MTKWIDMKALDQSYKKGQKGLSSSNLFITLVSHWSYRITGSITVLHMTHILLNLLLASYRIWGI